jgi:hypothetical protein
MTFEKQMEEIAHTFSNAIARIKCEKLKELRTNDSQAKVVLANYDVERAKP